jgi:carbohydrate-selective porin OprB
LRARKTWPARWAIACVVGCAWIAAQPIRAQEQSSAQQEDRTAGQSTTTCSKQDSTSTSNSNSSSNSGTSTEEDSTEPTFRCPKAADPHRRQRDCNDQEFGWDETLAHGWNDIGDVLKRIGLNPTASYIGALQSNVTGSYPQRWDYAGLFSFAVSVDLQEMIKVPGLSAYVGASWGTGSYLAGSLESPMATSGLYAPSFYLGEMYLQERFLHEKLTVLAGRLAPGNGFASLPVFTNYVTYGIDPNPYSIGGNDPIFFGPPPGSEWGAQATYTLTKSVQVAAGLFNTNPNSANGNEHGTDFVLQEGNKGAMSLVEVDYQRNQELSSSGRPMQIVVGFLHNNNSFAKLNDPAVRTDGYSGVYVLGQEMVYRPGGKGTTQGANVWGAWTYNTRDGINPIPQFWGAGASYNGLIPARKDDIVSIGVMHTGASPLAPQPAEHVLEVNYQWVHSRYLVITPHAQWQWSHQNGMTRNAMVLGLQVGLTL